MFNTENSVARYLRFIIEKARVAGTGYMTASRDEERIKKLFVVHTKRVV